MRYLRLIVGVLVFLLLLLGLAIKNTDSVTLRYPLGWEWRAPLVLMLLVFFVAGAVLGLLAGIGRLYRLRRELIQLKGGLPASDELEAAAPDRRLL